MLTWIGTTLVCRSGKWSLAPGRRTACPSLVKVLPGRLLPLPMVPSKFASAFVIVPNSA
jgi:hypothetical protein